MRIRRSKALFSKRPVAFSLLRTQGKGILAEKRTLDKKTKKNSNNLMLF